MITLNGTLIEPTIFPDKTSQVWKVPSDALTDFVSRIVWTFEHEAEFMHLAQLVDLAHSKGNACELVLPYLPYARQDKAVANDQTFALHTFARLLASLKFRSVTLCDPHNAKPIADALSSVGTVVWNKTYDAEALAAFEQCEADTLCLPDQGALVRYGHLHQRSRVVADKTRDQLTGAITGLAVPPCPGGRVFIVDDICDGGATFIGLAKALRENGAADVFLFVSHGLFTRGLAPLFDAGISRIFTPEGEKFR